MSEAVFSVLSTRVAVSVQYGVMVLEWNHLAKEIEKMAATCKYNNELQIQ
jgi:hypothetical protein